MTDLSSAVLHRLDRFAVIAVTGSDARVFLQGQLSFDLDRLTPQRMELASCSSAQGRVQAVLWLIERSDAIVLIVPSSTAETILTRLRKYVLRAKAKLEVSERLAVFAASGISLDQPAQSHIEIDGRSYVRWPGAATRVLCVAPADSGTPDSEVSARWHRDDIAAGLPQVYPQTHEAFVAQMLNLDVLGGISFEKGCYTGQEIIARTHFRGAIKRRMFRFRAAGSPPEPGTRIVAGDQHAGDVVDAASTSEGCELLAVVSLTQTKAALHLATSSGTPVAPLPLPYLLAEGDLP
jgi:folate-binding protein YgfZ